MGRRSKPQGVIRLPSLATTTSPVDRSQSRAKSADLAGGARALFLSYEGGYTAPGEPDIDIDSIYRGTSARMGL